MKMTATDRIEIALDAGAATLLAAAVTFATIEAGFASLISGASAAAAFGLAMATLRSIPPERQRFIVAPFAAAPIFEVREAELIHPEEPVQARPSAQILLLTHARPQQPSVDELVLTEADRAPSRGQAGDDILVLTAADQLVNVPNGRSDELVLTDADRLPITAPPTQADELLLDDILAELGPDSRVVRLFDPAAMPTPGELRARIDRHLSSGRAPAPVADASEALHEALAELRRSIR